MKKIILISTLVLFLSFLSVNFAMAACSSDQINISWLPSTINGRPVPYSCVANLTELMGVLLNWTLGVASAIAILMFMYAGFIYIGSSGSPDAIQNAKQIMITTAASIAALILVRVIFWVVTGSRINF